MKILYYVVVLTAVLFVHPAQASPPKDDPSWIVLHTRLKLASPNQTYAKRADIAYDYSDYRTINAGADVKLQFFRGLYSEYSLLMNLYNQMTNQLMAGIETPTSVVRFGIRYLFCGEQFVPDFDRDGRDLQMYINLGSARTGLEIALGNLNKIISGTDPDALEALSVTDVQINLNIGLWSTD